MPFDYFLWGFIKNRIIATASTTREDMKDRIGQACSEITIEQLIKVCQAKIATMPTTRR